MFEFYTDAEQAFTRRAEDNMKAALVGFAGDLTGHLTDESLEVAAACLQTTSLDLRREMQRFELDSANKHYFSSRLEGLRDAVMSAEALGQDLRFGLVPRDAVAESDINARASDTLDESFRLIFDKVQAALGYSDPAVQEAELTQRLLVFGRVIGKKQPRHLGSYLQRLADACEVGKREKASDSRYLVMNRMAVLAQVTGHDLVMILAPKTTAAID